MGADIREITLYVVPLFLVPFAIVPLGYTGHFAGYIVRLVRAVPYPPWRLNRWSRYFW